MTRERARAEEEEKGSYQQKPGFDPTKAEEMPKSADESKLRPEDDTFYGGKIRNIENASNINYNTNQGSFNKTVSVHL